MDHKEFFDRFGHFAATNHLGQGITLEATYKAFKQRLIEELAVTVPQKINANNCFHHAGRLIDTAGKSGGD